MENKNELYKESKKIFMITMKKYIKYYTPIVLLSLGALITLFWFKDESFNYVSMGIVIGHLLSASIFLVIFDGGPARTIKKNKFKMSGMTKDQGIVFYNALRLRSIFRGVLNVAVTLVLLVVVIIQFVI